jgi:hypothetical protein
MTSRHYPPRAPKGEGTGWGRHWLSRNEQRKFREALLTVEGHRCFYCGAMGVPVEAHHETVTTGHMACRPCHRRLTEENQLRGNPPPLP